MPKRKNTLKKVVLPAAPTYLLYIATSVWVQRTPNAGQNLNFLSFLCWKAKIMQKEGNLQNLQNLATYVFLSLRQNAGGLF